jgi:hypothetical protein
MELLQRRKFCREFLNGYNEKMHPQIISRVFEIGLLTLRKNYNKILFTKEELDEIIKSFNGKDYVEILPLPPLKKKEKSNNQNKIASPSPKHNCYLNTKFNDCPYLKTKIINKRKLYDKYLLNPNFTTQNSAIYPYWWWNNKEDKNEEPKDNLNVEENYNDNNEYYNNNEVYEYNKNDNLEYININEGEEEENNYQNYPQRQEYENDAMRKKNYSIKKLTMNSYNPKNINTYENNNEYIYYENPNIIPKSNNIKNKSFKKIQLNKRNNLRYNNIDRNGQRLKSSKLPKRKNMNNISNINNKSVQEPQIRKFKVQQGLSKGENNLALTKGPKFRYLYANNKIVRIPEENFS